ncbi:copper resistance protein B [Brevundimonas fontaquae]|uniref:Copper resistance protein B n=1 Tax=Brevundimonas fontaquae TaxID=2813778 RepID=A0ABX7LJ11_9CAUL|nr:copper resistance protein B [Brevundimonas fontaquae]QSF52841.1 copper resistance protein B [Brevundimonas fontaquae]
MNRLAVALAPLILAASGLSAQAQDPHAGHVMPAAPAPMRPAAAPVVPPQTSAPPATQDPHAGHVMPPAQTPPATDPHAGHQMPEAQTVDPHAGYDMSAMAPVQADPHAGHDMSTMVPAAQPDPHAGHDMSTMTPAQADPHAGHDTSTTTVGPPDVPTSADNPGRPPEDSLPAAALGDPVHAADLVFGADAMAASRRTLIRENGDVRTTAVVIDRLEAGFGDDGESYLWDVQGWSGGDINRFWWKSEGKGDLGGRLEDAEVQALYSRAVAPFWDVQAGVRQDFRPDGEDTTHLVLGVQGLAPYWWEIDAAAFLSTEGDLTARVEAEYDQRITQRLILQPRFEFDASASDIPELEIGSGLSSVEAGLRLRYEFRKEFAPYVGVEWSRALGDTADYIEARGGEADDTRFVVGLKAWF